MFENEYYEKELLNSVWNTIEQSLPEWQKGRAAVVRKLSVTSKIGEATIWRLYNPESKQKFNSKTLERLLSAINISGPKAFDVFKAEIDTQARDKGDAYWEIKKDIGDNPFLNGILDSFEKASLFANSTEYSEGLGRSEGSLFFRFIKSLHSAYTNEKLFTSLNIVADRDGIVGSLLMKDYFIQLSYVSQTEIKAREALIRNETELNKLKIQRSIDNNLQLTKDYIINFSLQNIQNLLVLGNPGVGKSTFGRWLCHTWAQQPEVVGNTIPVYIQLKGLEFNKEENAIVKYACRNYLIGDKTETKELHGLFRKAVPFICLILDGYDELAEEQKEMLFFCLREISSNCKYILTSRPYGILKDYGLAQCQAIQIDGFDTANINNYIDTFLKKNTTATGRTKEQLLEIIQLNPTLTDFAHNPLMLSFIVYIYLSDNNAHDTFKQIQTRFDLQQVVISWMFTHNKNKISTRLDAALINATAEMACEMELAKAPEKRGNPQGGEVETVLIPLSQIGIGHYTENNMEPYKFYFNSITFQEYFASIAIAGKITSQALEYLLQDSYFCNLTAMVIGQVNSATTTLVMDSLLESCEKELREEERDYSYYKYVLLLSECRAEYLNNRLNHEALTAVHNAFAQIYKNKNEQLKYSVAECVQRIYNKASHAHQREFKEIVVAQIATSWLNPDDKALKWDACCRHMAPLVKYLDLNNDLSFIKKCAALLTTALEELNADIADFSAAWDLPDFVLAIIQDNSDAFFQQVRPFMEGVVPLLPGYFIQYKGKIQAHYSSAKIALGRLKDNIAEYNRKEGEIIDEALVAEVALNIFVLGKRSKELETENDIAECQSALERATPIIIAYLESKGTKYNVGYVDGPQPITQLAAEGLFEAVNHKNNYPRAISVIAALGDEYLFFDQLAVQHIYGYFDEIMKQPQLQLNEAQLEQICTMIYCIPALKNRIAFHRNEIASQLNNYIESNSDAFTEEKRNSKVDYLLHLMERGDEFINETDRRFFTQKILESSNSGLPYIKNGFLPSVLSKYITLYDSLYWDFISTYLNAKDENAIAKAITIYTNEQIYQYTTNIPHILALFRFLASVESQPYYNGLITKNAGSLLEVASRTLMMLKQASYIDSLTRNAIVVAVEGLLEQDLLKTELTGKLATYRKDGIGNAAYILLYYFNNDAAFNLNIDYWEQLAKNKLRDLLIQFLYPGFVYHGALQTSELGKIAPVTGSEFINGMHKYHEQMKVYNFPFAKEQFTDLCSN